MEKVQFTGIGEISIVADQPDKAKWNLLLAHGAGAGLDHPFLASLSHFLVQQGFRVIRFNFPYKERGKKMPGSPKEAILCWKRLIEYAHARFPELPIYVSGKSYGGRMASHLLADDALPEVKGLIYFGFPLHAPGKPSVKRAAHLPQIYIPQLFLQGTRDKLADVTLLQQVCDPIKNATLVFYEAADHSFKVPKSRGVNPENMLNMLAKDTAKWVNET